MLRQQTTIEAVKTVQDDDTMSHGHLQQALKARRIVDDPSLPSHVLFSLLPAVAAAFPPDRNKFKSLTCAVLKICD